MSGYAPIYVVLGGGGFIGRHVCETLRRTGAQIRVMSRKERPDGVAADIDWLEGDVEDAPTLAQAIRGANVVFHLASAFTPGSAESRRLDDLVSNTGGTLKLLDLCVRLGVPRVVYASSGGTVYGAASLPPFREETTAPHPISAYGISKLAAEGYLTLYNRMYGMQNISLRISNPYGPYQNPTKNQGVVAVFINRMLDSEPLTVFGDGSVMRDYVYVEDVAAAFAAAATYSGLQSIFNIGSGIGVSLCDVIKRLEFALTRRAQIDYRPPRLFDVPVSVLDCTLAEEELGWRAETDWSSALRITTEWVLNARR